MAERCVGDGHCISFNECGLWESREACFFNCPVYRCVNFKICQNSGPFWYFRKDGSPGLCNYCYPHFKTRFNVVEIKNQDQKCMKCNGKFPLSVVSDNCFHQNCTICVDEKLYGVILLGCKKQHLVCKACFTDEYPPNRELSRCRFCSSTNTNE